MLDDDVRPGWARYLWGTANVLLMAVALAAGSVLGWIGRSEVMTEALRQRASGTTPQQVFSGDLDGRTYLNILILGCDEDRYYAGRGRAKPGQVLQTAARSDMMLVARLDFTAKRITGISIPRDTFLSLDGYRPQKINAYHAIGVNEGGPERGKELAQKAAEQVLGVAIDRVVVLDFVAFQEMVDLMGGIEVFVPRDMKYTDRAGGLFIDIKKGRQRLNGYDAMCYVRFRKGDSDFQRQDRQKEFMLSFKDRALEKWQVSPEVVDKSIELLGRAFSPSEVASLALFGQAVGGDNVKMEMVPVHEIRGTTYLEVDQLALDEVLRDLGMLSRSGSTVSSR